MKVNIPILPVVELSSGYGEDALATNKKKLRKNGIAETLQIYHKQTNGSSKLLILPVPLDSAIQICFHTQLRLRLHYNATNRTLA